MLEPQPDSFLIYWPKIKDLDIPQPKTHIIDLIKEEFEISFEGISKYLVERVEEAIHDYFDLPVFLRTDLASGKHGWKDTCYYDGSKPLSRHLMRIFEFNHCADFLGLQFTAVIIREYIPMASGFTAFYGDMPVNPERRYFIKDGEILCHHPYWIPEAIEAGIQKPSIDDWRDISIELNHEEQHEITTLTYYALMVAKVMEGFWSVDFCKGVDGKWYLIDMATGYNSWHPKECQFATE